MSQLTQSIDRTMVHGATLLVLEDKNLRFVRLVIAWQLGSLCDPQGKSGAMACMLEMLLRGSSKLDRRGFNKALELMGSRVEHVVNHHMLLLQVDCLARHVEATVHLLAQAILQPTFCPDEWQRLQSDVLEHLQAGRDDDEAVADLFLRQALFGEHLLGREPSGCARDIRGMELKDILQAYTMLSQQKMLIAMAGQINLAQATALMEPWVGHLPAKAQPLLLQPLLFPAATERLILVDKPARTQVQMRLANLLPQGRHPDADALWLAVTAFGGTFTSPLTREIRDERGWSYIAQATWQRYSLSLSPMVWHTAPAVTDACACLAWQMKLSQQLSGGLLETQALQMGYDFLLNRAAFDSATVIDLLGLVLSAEFLGLPLNYPQELPKRLAQLDMSSIPDIISYHLQKYPRVMLLVASAQTLLPKLQHSFTNLPIEIVDYRMGLELG